MSKFVLTGGHHNSALVVARKLISLGHEVEWIGHRHATRYDTNDSAEYLEVTKSGIKFHNLVAGKSSFSLKNVADIPLGLAKSFSLLKSISPDAIISFGGYIGFNICLAAIAHNLPIFLHEQTVVSGKANKFISAFAKRIYLTWPSSLKRYPKSKSLVVGLPLRENFLSPKKTKLFKNDKPTILILCGKQGSSYINNIIFNNLEDLLSKFNLIHQTGTSSVTGDYDKAISFKNSLSQELANSYRVEGYIDEYDIATIIENSDLIVGRSGAHVTYELGLLGKKSILIPYMHTHGHEQLQNARVLKDAGLGTILHQSNLTYPLLLESIITMLKRDVSHKLTLPLNATDTMVKDILASL